MNNFNMGGAIHLLHSKSGLTSGLNHVVKVILLGVMLLGTTILPVREVRAQGSCSTAIGLTFIEDSLKVDTFSVTGSEIWLSFVAESSKEYQFFLLEIDGDTIMDLKHFSIEGVNCNDLQVVSMDSFVLLDSLHGILGWDLVQDSTYFLRVTNPGNNSKSLKLSYTVTQRHNHCPTDPCDLSGDPDFTEGCWLVKGFSYRIVNQNMALPGLNHYAMSYGQNANGSWSWGIGQEINFAQGVPYIFSFFRRIDVYNGSNYGYEVTLYNEADNPGLLPSFNQNVPVWNGTVNVIHQETNLTGGVWEQVQVCFTPTQNFDRILISPYATTAGNGFLGIHYPQIMQLTAPNAGNQFIQGCINAEAGIADPGCSPYNADWRWWDVNNQLYVATGSPAMVPSPGEYQLHLYSFADNLIGCTNPLLSSGSVHAYLNTCYTPGDLVIQDGQLASSITGGVLNSGHGTIHVAGTFLIDVGFIFDGAEIIVCQGGRIEVLAGITLEVLNNTHIKGCGAIWDGILVNNAISPNWTKVIVTNSMIEHAESAIFCVGNRSVFEVKGSTLNRNFFGITIYNYTRNAVSNSFIHSSTISCKTLVGGPGVVPGLGLAEAGIRVFNDANGVTNPNTLIRIGDSSEDPVIFTHLRRGISSWNGNIQVNNCQFGEAGFTMNHGIYARGRTNQAVNNYVIIGDQIPSGATFSNHFTNIHMNGVFIENDIDGEVKNCYFSGMLQTGVRVDNCNSMNFVKVENNLIEDFRQFGINALGNANAYLFFNANVLNNAAWNGYSTGIHVDNIWTSDTGGLEINYNLIDDVQVGISHNRNNFGLLGIGSIIGNEINFLRNDHNFPAIGIRSQTSSANILIEENTIMGSSNNDIQVIGLDLQQPGYVDVLGNHIETAGRAVYMFNQMAGDFFCNDMKDYRRGIEFDNWGQIGNWVNGDANTPTDNRWLTHGSGIWDTWAANGSDMATIATWYVCDGSAGYCDPIDDFDPQNSANDGTPNVSTLITTSIAGTSPCAGYQRLAGTGIRQLNYSEKFRNKVIALKAYSDTAHLNSPSVSWGQLELIYHLLRKEEKKGNSPWLTRYSPEWTLLNRIKTQTYIPAWETVDSLVMNRVYSASGLTGGVGPFAADAAVVNELMLKKLSEYDPEDDTIRQRLPEPFSWNWTSSEAAILEDIAIKNPVTSGPAVIRARTLLGKNIPELSNAIAFPSNKMLPEETRENKSILVFPNPAQDRLFVELLEERESGLTLTFYRMDGVKAGSEIIPSTKGVYPVSLKQLLPGIYFMIASDKDAVLVKEKLIIY